MERQGTFVDALFASTAGFLGTAARVVCSPASRMYDNLQSTREGTKRSLWLSGLRVLKIRSAQR